MARKKRELPATREELDLLTRAMEHGTERARLRAAKIVAALVWPVPGEDLRAREAWMAGEAWRDWQPWDALEKWEDDEADSGANANTRH